MRGNRHHSLGSIRSLLCTGNALPSCHLSHMARPTQGASLHRESVFGCTPWETEHLCPSVLRSRNLYCISTRRPSFAHRCRVRFVPDCPTGGLVEPVPPAHPPTRHPMAIAWRDLASAPIRAGLGGNVPGPWLVPTAFLNAAGTLSSLIHKSHPDNP